MGPTGLLTKCQIRQAVKSLAAELERVPADAEDHNQAALAAPLFRFRHQANRPIPPNPEAKSGKAAGSGAADGGSVTVAINKRGLCAARVRPKRHSVHRDLP